MFDFFVTPRTAACQAPLSMEFFGQEYWSGLPFPPQRDLPNPGVESTFPVSPALLVDSLPPSHQGSSSINGKLVKILGFVGYSLSCNYSTLLLYTVLRNKEMNEYDCCKKTLLVKTGNRLDLVYRH